VPSGPLAPIVHYMDNTRQMQPDGLLDWLGLAVHTSDITRTGVSG
jgi:Xaa-Pro aminopeptidase